MTTKRIIALKLIALACVFFVGCQSEMDITPKDDLENQNGLSIATTDVDPGKTFNPVVGERAPMEGIAGPDNGPATRPEGADGPGTESAIAAVPFIVNAGVIWKDPAGPTHLLALQLPSTSARAVKWQSLGTGWQGTTHLAMDAYNFYAVWNNGVYRIPKNSPGAWQLIVPSNGKAITAITGFGHNFMGFSFTRIVDGTRSGLYYYTPWTGVKNHYTTCSECVFGFENVRDVTSFTTIDGKTSLYITNTVYDTDVDSYYTFQDAAVGEGWNFGGTASKNNIKDPIRVTANPMTKAFYYTKPSVLLGAPQIYKVPVTGPGNLAHEPFSFIRYEPYDAPVVTNDGFVWIMGKTLQQLMTTGPYKGQSGYNEGGWGGIKLACAEPTVVVP